MLAGPRCWHSLHYKAVVRAAWVFSVWRLASSPDTLHCRHRPVRGKPSAAGAVPLNVDLDVVLSVPAHTVCAAMRRRLPGYRTATPDTLRRRFLFTGGVILNHGREIVIRLNRRTYSPILRQADLPTIAVPWWGGRQLRFEPP